jgi:hypothetical protein
MKNVLEYILEKLPDHRNTITELYEVNDDFRTLCEDYVTTAKGLEESRNNSIRDRELENEFAHTYLELEREIIYMLGNAPKPSGQY